MDGNGRWAQKRLLNRIKGHEQGTEAVRRIVRASRRIGIRYLTLYAFSTENWQRPGVEVSALMELLARFLDAELPEMMANDIRLSTIGQTHRLPHAVRQRLERVMDATGNNRSLCLTLALSYGSRSEIVDMVKAIGKKALAGQIDLDRLGEPEVAAHLCTGGMPDPDLLIRTSGEMRLSNFLLWQIAYAEIFVTDTLWPDFSEQEFIDILKAFGKRQRRFGRVAGDVSNQ
jgi:undecaprenyl diphosphate synthase